jgi:hypothetical protein
VTATSIPPCPASGAGVHSWKMSVANLLRRAGLSQADAVLVIDEHATRPPSPGNETVVTVAKAYGEPWQPLPGGARHTYAPARRKLVEVQFDCAKLETMAAKIAQPKSWRHWLWERSPKRPEAMNPWSFLAHLYRPGERVQVFDRMESGAPIATVFITQPMDCRVPGVIRNGGRHGAGVWFLSNPVDGEWHLNPRLAKLSCRSAEAVTSFRYAVLESDQAPAYQWLAFVAQLPLRVAAIYTSGSRSVHCLIRLDAPSKAAWDAVIQPLKRPLKVLGADPACLSAVRLTRLPGCHRPEKGGFQRLLYLCPNPPEARLMDLPVLRTRVENLERWRNVCPRWNPNQEANQ